MNTTSRVSTFAKSASIALATVIVAASTVLTATSADAGKKPVYSQDYQFDKPMHGFEGRAAGGYYCSYQRIPNRVCKVTKSGKEKCKVKGWTLRQTCY